MSKSDIEAGKSFVRLYLKDEVTRQIRKTMTQVGTTVAAAGGAITAAMGASLKIFASTGDQLDKMSQRTGIAASQLAAYGFAAEQSGSNLEAFELAIKNMQRTMGDMQGMSPEDQFEAVAKRIAEIEDPSKRAAEAIRVFGRAGTSMLPMLNNLQELKAEARDLGIIPSEEEVKRAAEVTDAINRVKRVTQQMFFDVGAAISDDVLGALEAAKQAGVVWGQWIRENREIITTVAKVGVTLLALGTTLVAVAKAWGAASAAAALMYANPVLLGIAALAAGIALVTIALNKSKVAAEAKARALKQAADAAKAEHEAGKQMRTEDIDRMKRLETLQELQRKFGSLTKEQTAEAAGLIATLSGRYGDLGITLDETTGQLSGVTGAMQGMVSVMKEMAAIELDKEIAALQKQAAAAEERMAELSKGNIWSAFFNKAGATKAEFDQWGAEYEETSKRMLALMEQREKLAGGGMEGVTYGGDGDGTPAGGGTTATEEERLRFAERVAKRRGQIELDRIDDQERKELEAINRRYQEERAEAQRLEMDLTALAETTELEKFRVREKYAAQRAEEDKRRIADAAETEKRRVEEIAQLRQDLETRVARQEIEAKFAGDPDARRRALIEFEHRLEMEAIAARKGITEDEKKMLEALAERSRDLRLGEEQAEKEVVTKTAAQQTMRQVTTHSAAAAQAAGFGGAGGSPQERTVSELRALRDQQKEMVRLANQQAARDQEMLAKWGQFVTAMQYS